MVNEESLTSNVLSLKYKILRLKSTAVVCVSTDNPENLKSKIVNAIVLHLQSNVLNLTS